MPPKSSSPLNFQTLESIRLYTASLNGYELSQLLDTVPAKRLVSSLVFRTGELPAGLQRFTMEELKEAKKDVEDLDEAKRRAEQELSEARKQERRLTNKLTRERMVKRRSENELSEARMQERLLMIELTHERELRRRSDEEVAFMRAKILDYEGR